MVVRYHLASDLCSEPRVASFCVDQEWSLDAAAKELVSLPSPGMQTFVDFPHCPAFRIRISLVSVTLSSSPPAASPLQSCFQEIVDLSSPGKWLLFYTFPDSRVSPVSCYRVGCGSVSLVFPAQPSPSPPNPDTASIAERISVWLLRGVSDLPHLSLFSRLDSFASPFSFSVSPSSLPGSGLGVFTSFRLPSGSAFRVREDCFLDRRRDRDSILKVEKSPGRHCFDLFASPDSLLLVDSTLVHASSVSPIGGKIMDHLPSWMRTSVAVLSRCNEPFMMCNDPNFGPDSTLLSYCSCFLENATFLSSFSTLPDGNLSFDGMFCFLLSDVQQGGEVFVRYGEEFWEDDFSESGSGSGYASFTTPLSYLTQERDRIFSSSLSSSQDCEQELSFLLPDVTPYLPGTPFLSLPPSAWQTILSSLSLPPLPPPFRFDFFLGGGDTKKEEGLARFYETDLYPHARSGDPFFWSTKLGVGCASFLVRRGDGIQAAISFHILSTVGGDPILYVSLLRKERFALLPSDAGSFVEAREGSVEVGGETVPSRGGDWFEGKVEKVEKEVLTLSSGSGKTKAIRKKTPLLSKCDLASHLLSLVRQVARLILPDGGTAHILTQSVGFDYVMGEDNSIRPVENNVDKDKPAVSLWRRHLSPSDLASLMGSEMARMDGFVEEGCLFFHSSVRRPRLKRPTMQ